MSRTWRSDDLPVRPVLRLRDWPRVVLRAVPLGVVLSGGLALLLILRLAERPLCGQRRPVTPAITQAVCRLALWLIGLHREVSGVPLRGQGVMVANHQSWLDIFALNAGGHMVFVAKSEVAGWPGIGWLARATGTVFVRRDRGEVAGQIDLVTARLVAGQLLVLFPEGTSTDGQQVLAFRPALFAACEDPSLREKLQVQPVTLHYVPAAGTDGRFYGWWGDMGFAPHLLMVLAARRQGVVRITCHAALRVADYPDRKALAAAAEARVRGGLAG